MFRSVLVTGGAGYVGSLLTPQLLDLGYRVTVYDIMYFGEDFLPKNNPDLKVVEGDIRDIGKLSDALKGVEVVINLACISNDASFELDEKLSTSINLDAFEPLVIAAKQAGVKRFIYASSSSVYGVSDAPEVTEEHPLVPLTLYNKYKGLCEPRLFKHQSPGFVCVTIRPATLCGYAPRQRLDLSVNILTNTPSTTEKSPCSAAPRSAPISTYRTWSIYTSSCSLCPMTGSRGRFSTPASRTCRSWRSRRP